MKEIRSRSVLSDGKLTAKNLNAVNGICQNCSVYHKYGTSSRNSLCDNCVYNRMMDCKFEYINIGLKK